MVKRRRVARKGKRKEKGEGRGGRETVLSLFFKGGKAVQKGKKKEGGGGEGFSFSRKQKPKKKEKVK